MKYKKKTIKSILSMILSFSMILSSVLTTAWTVNAVNAIVGEKSEYGIVGSMTGWGMYDDFPMYETETGIFVGSMGIVPSGEYAFEVRKDGSWEEVWSEYSEYDDRTKNNQTTISVHLDEKAELLVKLDTTIYEEKLWAVSYAIITESDIEPNWIYTGKEQIDKKSPYGIVGNMTGWGKYDDFPMHEIEEGIFVGSTGTLQSGEYVFEVRKDSDWTDIWSKYSEDYYRTKNSDTNISVYLDEDAELLVKLDTMVDEENLWSVSYKIGDGEWIYTGKPVDEEPSETSVPVEEPSNEPSELEYYETVVSDYIYFDNSETQWNEVYAYWWHTDYARTFDLEGNDWGCVLAFDSETGISVCQPVAYPGTKMTKIEGTDVWQIRIPFNAERIIFNDGKSDEQIFSGEISYVTKDINFDSIVNAGQIYMTNSSVDPKQGRGIQKTKYTYEYGEWVVYNGFYNSEKIGADDFEYCINADDTVTITKYIGSSKENVTIPDTIDGKMVTSIDEYTFYGCIDLTSITIPDSVTSIGHRAFYRCKGLADENGFVIVKDILFDYYGNATSIEIPTGVKTIDGLVFYGCESLTSITIPDSVISIGDSAFEDCTGLTSITIPNSVTEMGSRAFYGCENLQSVLISENIQSWDDDVFYGMWSSFNLYGKKGSYAEKYAQDNEHENFYLIDGNDFAYSENNDGTVAVVGYLGDDENIVISNKLDGKTVTQVYSMNRSHDKDIENIKSIVISNSVKYISNNAFRGCTGLVSIDVDKNNTVYSSDNGVLLNKDKTKVILCPEGKKGTYVIPNSVTEIHSNVFWYCTGLTSIEISNSVAVIDNWAFLYCKGLTSINVSKDNTIYSSVDGVLFNKDKTKVILCPEGKKGAYTIPNSVKEIDYHAFENCKELTSIEIPNSVTSIGYYAFRDCTSLKNIEIPDSVTSIGGSAFDGCTGLINIEIPDGVISVGESAFKDTTWYNNQPDGLVYVGKVAYKYKGEMPKNTSIQLKDGTVSISDYAFWGCGNLTDIVIPNSVMSIGNSAFYDCTGLTNVTLPNSVTEIGNSAFYGCTGLTSIEISDSVTEIGGFAFDATAWYNIQPDGLIYVGKVAYEYKGEMPKNTSIQLKNGTVSISDYAFWGCKGLISVEIPDSVEEIGFFAFKGCSNLKTINEQI